VVPLDPSEPPPVDDAPVPMPVLPAPVVPVGGMLGVVDIPGFVTVGPVVPPMVEEPSPVAPPEAGVRVRSSRMQRSRSSPTMLLQRPGTPGVVVAVLPVAVLELGAPMLVPEPSTLPELCAKSCGDRAVRPQARAITTRFMTGSFRFR